MANVSQAARIYIAVPCYGRPVLAFECIRTIDEARFDADSGTSLNSDVLALYEDGENQLGEASSCADEIHRSKDSIGVDAQRKRHFIDFWNRHERDGLTHLALFDSDVIVDPTWREKAIGLHSKYRGAPLCLYRTRTHAEYEGNIYRDMPSEDVIWQRFAPGCSYFLAAEHVRQVMEQMPDGPIAWDWAVPGYLGYKMAVSRTSYVDHIGYRGLHDKNADDLTVSTERALLPTDWLKSRRASVLATLGLQDA